MRMKDASEAQVPCHSVAELFEPTQPYCFPQQIVPRKSRVVQGCDLRQLANRKKKEIEYEPEVCSCQIRIRGTRWDAATKELSAIYHPNKNPHVVNAI